MMTILSAPAALRAREGGFLLPLFPARKWGQGKVGAAWPRAMGVPASTLAAFRTTARCVGTQLVPRKKCTGQPALFERKEKQKTLKII
jgi:hypothetical protein